MTQRIILAGGGSISRHAGEILSGYDCNISIVEQDADRCEELGTNRFGTVIQGDPTKPRVLEQAAPDQADVFAALTANDRTNRRLCETITELTDEIRTVARIDQARGDVPHVEQTVRPQVVCAKAVANQILGWHIQLSPDSKQKVDILDVEVDPRAPVARRELNEVAFPAASQVVADSNLTKVATPEMKLRPGQRYVVATEPSVADEVRMLMVGNQ